MQNSYNDNRNFDILAFRTTNKCKNSITVKVHRQKHRRVNLVDKFRAFLFLKHVYISLFLYRENHATLLKILHWKPDTQQLSINIQYI